MIKINDTVRPVIEGEDRNGRVIVWNRLRGRVVAVWKDGNEQRAEIRWFGFPGGRGPLGSILPADYLEVVEGGR